MYFSNRHKAGRKLAKKLSAYKHKPVAVVALSDGGVLVGAEVAKKLKCALMMLLTEEIKLPGELNPLEVVNQDGGTTLNNLFSSKEQESFAGEYHSYIDQTKREKFHIINTTIGNGSLMNIDLLRRRNVILVSDGLDNSLAIDAVVDLLKPIEIERLIIASPIVSVTAIDRLRLATDEVCFLSVIDNYLDTNHYYEDNQMPDHETIMDTVKKIVLNFRENS